jgi:hypothetical protein
MQAPPVVAQAPQFPLMLFPDGLRAAIGLGPGPLQNFWAGTAPARCHGIKLILYAPCDQRALIKGIAGLLRLHLIYAFTRRRTRRNLKYNVNYSILNAVRGSRPACRQRDTSMNDCDVYVLLTPGDDDG